MTKVMRPSSKEMKYVAGACKVARRSLRLWLIKVHIPLLCPSGLGSLVQLINDALETL